MSFKQLSSDPLFYPFSDVSRLLETQPLPRSLVACGDGCLKKSVAQVLPQETTTKSATTVMAVSVCIAAAMLVVSMACVVYAQRYRRRQHESDRDVVLETMDGHECQ